MKTECITDALQFQPLGKRNVVGDFSGGYLTSDGGGLLLGEVEARTGIIRQFADCFTDHRDPTRIEHTKNELIAQRIYAIALGYEDVNDHDELRYDPLLATLVGKHEPLGNGRKHKRDRGKPLAGKSSINRLELCTQNPGKNRYKKFSVDAERVDRFFVDVFLQSFTEAPEEVILDLDATDDRVHGNQEGRFYHGYYGHYCYLPLYIFCDDFLLCARLRPANIDAAQGAEDELARIVTPLRAAWPEVRIIVRGDSGFCRESLMRWCEDNGVDFVLGMAKNARLKAEIQPQMEKAQEAFRETGRAARAFRGFRYRTRNSWSNTRRVVGKAEYLAKGENPRFVVTSLSPNQWPAQTLYEDLYCARGEMENRIKEQQLDLFADRTSTHEMDSNQVRLWLYSVGYMLLEALRRLGLTGTQMARSRCGTIRLKLLKIGALIRVTVRRVFIALAGGCPYESIFRTAYANILRAGP